MMKLKQIIIKLVYALMRLLPINKNNVLLFSYYGEQYSGAPKYISKYLVENSNFEVIWAFSDLQKHQSYKGKRVRYGHLMFYFYLATAGTIITNYRMTEEYKKRTGQKYIQTWHSSLRLKMIEKDAMGTLPERYVLMAKNDSKQLDYLLAGSKKSREIFERSFWYDGEIINSGMPQCDIFFEERTPYVNKVFECYNIPIGSHVAMYAPTFRKNHNMDVYNLDTIALIGALEQRFGGDWYILIRLHPHLSQKAKQLRYSDKVIQATDYDDAQELLCASDVLISDYSAIMFDYSVTRRPCFLYTPDYLDYTSKDRKLYFDIASLPFKSFINQSDLFEEIRHFSEEDYALRIENFISEIGSYDDGQASKRVYELMKGEIK